jgi:hypothetical protein
MLGVTMMKLFQAWVVESAQFDDVAAYNSQLLIVGMSATALQSEQEAAFGYGMHFFCPKPANMDILGLMISAKKQHDKNNCDAIQMICELTGTDTWAEEEEEEEEEGEEEDYEEGAGGATGTVTGTNTVISTAVAGEMDELNGVNANVVNVVGPGADTGAAAASEEASKVATMAAGTFSNVPGQELPIDSYTLSRKVAAARQSLLGSRSGSFEADGGGATGANGVPVDMLTMGAVGGSAVGGTGSTNSINGAIGAAKKGKRMARKADRDSRSAASWSVFRSHRQMRRVKQPLQVLQNASGYSGSSGGGVGEINVFPGAISGEVGNGGVGSAGPTNAVVSSGFAGNSVGTPMAVIEETPFIAE